MILQPLYKENWGLEILSSLPNVAELEVDRAGRRWVSWPFDSDVHSVLPFRTAPKQNVFWPGAEQDGIGVASFFHRQSSVCAGPLRPFLYVCVCFSWRRMLLKNWTLVLASSGRQTRHHIGSSVCYHLPCTRSCAAACNKIVTGFQVGISVFTLHCLLGRIHHSHVLSFMSC